MSEYTGVVKIFHEENAEKYYLYIEKENNPKEWEERIFDEFEQIIDNINQTLPARENKLKKIIKTNHMMNEKELRGLENIEDYSI